MRLASSLAFCLKLEGTVEEGNPEHPGKLRQSYYNPLKDQYLQFNFWVLYTDYDNLTVVYACEKTLGDGICDPGSTFIWTLSRGTSQSPAEKTKVQALSSSVCLDVASLRQMNHTTACPMTWRETMDWKEEESEESSNQKMNRGKKNLLLQSLTRGRVGVYRTTPSGERLLMLASYVYQCIWTRTLSPVWAKTPRSLIIYLFILMIFCKYVWFFGAKYAFLQMVLL